MRTALRVPFASKFVVAMVAVLQASVAAAGPASGSLSISARVLPNKEQKLKAANITVLTTDGRRITLTTEQKRQLATNPAALLDDPIPTSERPVLVNVLF
jgi:hypothetical protein